jgi:hypothetical protein
MLYPRQAKKEAVAVHANTPLTLLLSLSLMALSVAGVARGKLFQSRNLRLQLHQCPREAADVPARKQVWESLYVMLGCYSDPVFLGSATPVTPNIKKKDGRGRPRKNPLPNGDAEAKAMPAVNSLPETSRSFWLMKAEPESRMEKGKDVKFSIDDLAAADVPEPWDGTCFV